MPIKPWPPRFLAPAGALQIRAAILRTRVVTQQCLSLLVPACRQHCREEGAYMQEPSMALPHRHFVDTSVPTASAAQAHPCRQGGRSGRALCWPAPAAAASQAAAPRPAASHTGSHTSSTAGARLYQAAPGGGFTAPLLPASAGLPFSVSLDFVEGGLLEEGAGTPWGRGRGGRCLHYALAGEGQVVLGQQPTSLSAGDSILVEGRPPLTPLPPEGSGEPPGGLPGANAGRQHPETLEAEALESLLALLTFRFEEGSSALEEGGPAAASPGHPSGGTPWGNAAPVGRLTQQTVDRLFSRAAASTSHLGPSSVSAPDAPRPDASSTIEALLRLTSAVTQGFVAGPPQGDNAQGTGSAAAQTPTDAASAQVSSASPDSAPAAAAAAGAPAGGEATATSRARAEAAEEIVAACAVPESAGGLAEAQISGVALAAEEQQQQGSAPGGLDLSPRGLAAGLSTAVQAALDNTPVGFLSHVLPSIAQRIAQRVQGVPQGDQAGGAVVLQRRLQDLTAFQLPNQTNRLALVFDPLSDDVSFTFGLEIFEAGHRTTPHVHHSSHELFYVLAGRGEAFCGEERTPLGPGSCVIFPPGTTHGIDVAAEGRMYCLELMQPNDMFAELVKAGQPTGQLGDDDLCILAAMGCSGTQEGSA